MLLSVVNIYKMLKLLCAFQNYPLYHITTTWQKVVPKLNSKGHDLIKVTHVFNLEFYLFQLVAPNFTLYIYGEQNIV